MEKKIVETVIVTDDYKVMLEFEQVEGVPYVYIHLDLHRLTPDLVKQMRVDFVEILNSCAEHGFDEVFAYTPNLKLVDTICPYDEYIGSFPHDGEDYHVVSWYTVRKLL